MERYSKQREIILEVLKNRKDHPTAEMLYNEIAQKMPGIGIATVYRNLASLYKTGKIQKIETMQGEADRFDGDLRPHIHFECSKCNEIYDIFLDEEENTELNDKLTELTKIINADFTSSKIVLKGFCQKCKEK